MPNRLIHATSPYLLQHAHNPVDWYPWGEEALGRARAENKLLIISIGYSACHWCHVMEHESFEDPAVAEVMNAHFVCVKVDREERPDVDKVYMDALTMMTGQGGWPLNCFALPDGRPFYGGTYFRRGDWLGALDQLAHHHRHDPQRLAEYADTLQAAMQQGAQPPTPPLGSAEAAWAPADLQAVLDTWLPPIDPVWGGRRQNRNKFPLPQQQRALLHLATLAARPDALALLHTTLRRMAIGGMYDHVGGGFARYSVDAHWHVPHFEKMLYDNAQLVSLYAEAFRATGNPHYRRVLNQTLAFVARELTAPEGGCYAALDADSEGEEGKFYVWEWAELLDVLGPEDGARFGALYGARPGGNWEGRGNVLWRQSDETPESEPIAWEEACCARLLAAREGRIRPGLDDKIITAWNALMICGYVDAFRATGTAEYLAQAVRLGEFIAAQLAQGPRLWRTYKAGQASVTGFLDDYAAWVAACLALYQATFEGHWLELADAHMAHVLAQFDAGGTFFHYTPAEGEPLLLRKPELHDDVLPSSNGLMALNLHSMGLLQGRTDYMLRSEAMLAALRAEATRSPMWHATYLQLAARLAFPFREVAICGPEARAFRQQLDTAYRPDLLWAGAEAESAVGILAGRWLPGRTGIYVCRQGACQLPVFTPAEAVF